MGLGPQATGLLTFHMEVSPSPAQVTPRSVSTLGSAAVAWLGVVLRCVMVGYCPVSQVFMLKFLLLLLKNVSNGDCEL